MSWIDVGRWREEYGLPEEPSAVEYFDFWTGQTMTREQVERRVRNTPSGNIPGRKETGSDVRGVMEGK